MEEKKILFEGFIIIGEKRAPQAQYDSPATCRYCKVKLSKYNPLDACYACQKVGKISSPRNRMQPAEDKAEMAKMDEKLLDEVLSKIREVSHSLK